MQAELVFPAIIKCLFKDDLLKQITWTGKSNSKATKKISMKKHKSVIKLITDLCLAADRGYSEIKCEHDLIYKVCKYAYRKKSNIGETSGATDIPSSLDPNASVETTTSNGASEVMISNASMATPNSNKPMDPANHNETMEATALDKPVDKNSNEMVKSTASNTLIEVATTPSETPAKSTHQMSAPPIYNGLQYMPPQQMQPHYPLPFYPTPYYPPFNSQH